jgi:NAD(P)-dependent dehydrogenase (short-subunit alcohol dehydrogenase family)
VRVMQKEEDQTTLKQQQEDQEDQEDQEQVQCEFVSPEDVATACRVLQYFSTHMDEYTRPDNRALRAALQPLFESQKEKMFGGSGLNGSDYHKDKSQKERRKQEKNRIKLENERLLKLTTLRAGRIRRLENLKEGTGEGFSVVLDGPAEDGTAVNATSLHSDSNDQQCLKENGETKIQEPLKYATNSFRSCYICKRRFQDLHHFYDSLCPSCAQMNWKKRLQTCDMTGKICLVTGGRVKIGFQCCLKLLRCGATVIATSRFPCDTAKRFAAQSDHAEWRERIHVYGLDLRDLAYVEAFCDMTMQRYSHIDVIVNNACQTIRRPRAYYSHLILDEEKISQACCEMQSKKSTDTDTNANTETDIGSLGNDDVEAAALLSMLSGDLSYRASYTQSMSATPQQALLNTEAEAPRVEEEEEGEGEHTDGLAAGSGAGSGLGSSISPPSVSVSAPASSLPPPSSLSSAELSQVPVTTEDLTHPGTPLLFPAAARDVNNQQIDLRKKHSWLLRMHEVSTPEVAEVFAINSISPFVMIARLKPALAKTPSHPCTRQSRGDHADAAPHIPSLAEYILKEEEEKKNSSRKQNGKQANKASAPPYCKGGVSGTVHHEDCSFIVNVSSMEGKFYRRKMEAHPHTNMAKAALNMMTRTAAEDYKKSNIFMTAVDTGWINDENPLDKAAAIAQNHNFATPLDEVDAAARILDPVLYPLRKGVEHGEGACSPFYGCFLKDYFLSEW